MYVCLSVWVCVCASMHVCMCVCVRWYIPLYIWKTAFFQCNTFVLNVIGIYWLEWWIWEKNRQNENQVHGTKGKINNFWTQQSFYQFSVKCLAYSSCVGGFFVRSLVRSFVRRSFMLSVCTFYGICGFLWELHVIGIGIFRGSGSTWNSEHTSHRNEIRVHFISLQQLRSSYFVSRFNL